MAFDAAVNLGTGRSAKILQAAAGVGQDGAIGPNTLAAVGACTPTELISKLADERQAFYQSLATFSHFGNGWTARVNRAKQRALEMVQTATA
jgi:lysozyme family protein